MPEKDPRIPAAVYWICFAILMVGVFSGPLDIAQGVDTGGQEASRVAKVPSILLKLCNAILAGLLGAWGLVSLPSARAYLTSLPGLMLCAVAFIFGLTCATSITGSAIPITLVFAAYLIFVPTCLSVLKLRGAMAAALGGCLLYTVLALLLYVLVPSIGVFVEEFNDGVRIERLGALSQPNHTGRTAMFGFLITTYFLRVHSLTWRVGSLLLCVFMLAGVLAMSRTALLAVLICFVILNLDLLLTRLGAVVSLSMMLAGVAILFALLATGREDVVAKKLLGAVTKTGDIEEVTQVTGRYDIWERTVKLIGARPLQGYGLGSNKIMLIDHLQSTHNILLHPTLAAGLGAGGLTFLLLLWNLFNAATYPNLLIRALSAYLIISGLTEDTIYETFPGACTLLWLICCLWPISHYREEPAAALLGREMRP